MGETFPCYTASCREKGASTLCLEIEASADVVSEGADVVVCVVGGFMCASETGIGIGRTLSLAVLECLGICAAVMDSLFAVADSVICNCEVSGSVDVADTA